MWLLCLFIFLLAHFMRKRSERWGFTSHEEPIIKHECKYDEPPSPPRIPKSVTDDLAVLGLREMPGRLEELKRAYKISMLNCHPDVGGSTDSAVRVGRAMENLERDFKSEFKS